MPATVSIRSKFSWNAKAVRYQRADGRFVKEAAVKSATLRVVRNSGLEMQRLSGQLTRGEITIENWRDRFAAELKNLHVSGAMAGGGGFGQMTQADYGRVGAELRFQYQRLNRFAQQIKEGRLSNAQIIARSKLYVAGMNKTFEASRRQRASEVMTQEKNVLGSTDKHCATCLAQSALGWVPIGQLVPIGSRSCLANCLCRYVFRKTPISP